MIEKHTLQETQVQVCIFRCLNFDTQPTLLIGEKMYSKVILDELYEDICWRVCHFFQQ